MPELLRLYRCADIGWETVAECEACASRGDLSGVLLVMAVAGGN